LISASASPRSITSLPSIKASPAPSPGSNAMSRGTRVSVKRIATGSAPASADP
jgi:hypothetical protein